MLPGTIRTLLVDDFHSVRAGVSGLSKFIEEWAVCGEASTGMKALSLVHELSPEVVVLDISLPDFDGLEVLRQIKKDKPETEVVMFSGHTNEEYVRKALDLGARSYILKTDSIVDLVQAVRAAAKHEHYYTPRIAQIVVSRFRNSPKPDTAAETAAAEEPTLSEPDLQVVRYIAEGKRDEALAASLNVSVKDAELQCEAIMQRLGLKSASQLIRYAIRKGIIPA